MKWLRKVYCYMDIEIIRNLVKNDKIKWSNHCLERMGERAISIPDVTNCILNGKIIEDYPNDYPHPSALVFGYAVNNMIIHVVIGYDGEYLYFITAYIPNNIVFEDDLMTRRKR